MPLFNWYNQYSIGNDEIDRQHKKLFEIFNRLFYDCMSSDRNKVSTSVIDELIFYSEYHFETEENHMRNIDYKFIEKHIEDHNDFRNHILEYKQKKSITEHDICHDLILYLNKYIKNHMLEEDKKLAL